MAFKADEHLQEGECVMDKKLRKGIECCRYRNCSNCPYDTDEVGNKLPYSDCLGAIFDDIMQAIEDYENVIKLLEGGT